MSRRRTGATAIASNPVLVGVATTLVIVVAIFLAYNANQGLPWVPSYRLTAEVPSAANLVRGNEARIGGLRVGRDRQDHAGAEGGRHLHLDPRPQARDPRAAAPGRLDDHHPAAVGPGPQVRPDHAGARRARASTTATGSRSPATRKTRPVDIDEFYSMFDEPRPATAAQENLAGYGSAFAGRGESINRAIEALVPLAMQRGEAVFKQHHRASSANFEDFFKEQGDAARIVAPVAEIQAALFVNLDRDLHRVRRGSRTPTSEQSITPRPERPRHRHRGVPEGACRSSRTRSSSSPSSSPAPRAARFPQGPRRRLRDGCDRRRSARSHLNKRLTSFLRSARSALATTRSCRSRSRDLVDTSKALDPTLQYLTPAQTVCNYIGLFMRNASFLASRG